MRSITSAARGTRSAASRLVPTALATAVVATAACSDTTPTAVRPNMIAPDSASAMVIPFRCPDACTRIVYSHRTSAADVTPEIYVMGGDGSNKKKLADGDRPTWSPDHVKIAFTKSTANNNYEIFSMNADGSGVTQLTFSPSQEIDPSWSPDRTKIAYASSKNGSYDIWVMLANGAMPFRLTTNDLAQETAPAWSPDGTRIAYVSAANGASRVLITDVTTKVTTPLYTGTFTKTSAPAWSPDGKRIAFQTDPTPTSCGIHIADVGGSGNVFDFTGPGYGSPCITPNWSPDGKKLAWEELVSGGGIMVMTANVDGTGGYNGLTFGAPFVDRWPVWGFR